MGLGFWPWKFQWVKHNFVEFQRRNVSLSGISKGKVTDLKIPGRSPTTELPAGLTIKWVWLGPNFYIFHDLLPHCNHSAI